MNHRPTKAKKKLDQIQTGSILIIFLKGLSVLYALTKNTFNHLIVIHIRASFSQIIFYSKSLKFVLPLIKGKWKNCANSSIFFDI